MTFRLGYVILHYKFDELTEACLASVTRHAPGAEIMVLDNGSPVPFQWRGRTLRLPANVCLATAMNRATDDMFAATGPAVVVQLNNDALLTGNTHKELTWAFQSRPRLGVAAPMMDQEDAGAMYQPCPADPGPEAEAYLSAQLPRQELALVPSVDNVAFAIRRQAWQEIGRFDERFSGASWGAAYDYCWRARLAGWEVGLVRSAFVFHRHRATWNQIDPEYPYHAASRMIREMRQKWGEAADRVAQGELTRLTEVIRTRYKPSPGTRRMS
jgi:GT2 family glycosyltransferase